MKTETAGRVGGWIGMYSGRKFWPLDPRAQEIHIPDVVQSLSHQCRFGGHCETFYSVAEHCVLVAEILKEWGHNQDIQFAGLMHDASEAYLVDIPRPYKASMPEYQVWEERIQREIEKKYGMTVGLLHHPLVKEADERALIIESKSLFLDTRDWVFGETPISAIREIKRWGSGEAARKWLDAFLALGGMERRVEIYGDH